MIGVPHDRWGETVKAVAALRPGAAATPEELIAHCRSSLATFMSPTTVDVVEALPRNPTGKISSATCASPTGWAGTALGLTPGTPAGDRRAGRVRP